MFFHLSWKIKPRFRTCQPICSITIIHFYHKFSVSSKSQLQLWGFNIEILCLTWCIKWATRQSYDNSFWHRMEFFKTLSSHPNISVCSSKNRCWIEEHFPVLKQEQTPSTEQFTTHTDITLSTYVRKTGPKYEQMKGTELSSCSNFSVH